MKKDFGSSARSVSDLKAHLGLKTKHRRKEFPEEINKVYWKQVLWNESYFIASCGGVTISVLKKYIEGQNTPDD